MRTSPILDWLVYLAGLALAALVIYWQLRFFIDESRRLTARHFFLALAGLAILAAGLLLLDTVERLTGVPAWLLLSIPAGALVALAIRRATHERARRRAFVQGRTCPWCNRTLEMSRTRLATHDAEDWNDRFAYMCECGTWTLFEPDGTFKQLENRTGRT